MKKSIILLQSILILALSVTLLISVFGWAGGLWLLAIPVILTAVIVATSFLAALFDKWLHE